MTRDDQKVQDALLYAMSIIRDHVADPRTKAMLFSKVEEAQLIHKGTLR